MNKNYVVLQLNKAEEEMIFIALKNSIGNFNRILADPPNIKLKIELQILFSDASEVLKGLKKMGIKKEIVINIQAVYGALYLF